MDLNKATQDSKDKIPLIMLHGLLGRPDNWQPVIPFLPKNSHPIIIHLPLFDEDMNLKNVDDVLDYLQQYLEKSGLDRVVVMGNSFGGHLAALLSLRLPQKVSAIVLTASGGLAERGFARVPGTRPQKEWIREKAAEIFYSPSHVTDEVVDDVMGIILDRKKARTLLSLAKSVKRENIKERLNNIHCPTLLVWGKQDKITPPEVAEEFHAQIPHSELVWIDKCGHAPMMEHPKEFSKQLNIWWEKIFPSK